MRILALDFETSGLNPGVHAPVSLGVALMEDGEVVAQKEWMIAPPRNKEGKITRSYDVVALEISGASWPRLKRDGLSPMQVCAELMGFAKEHDARGVTVVAFNSAFDHSWYSDLLFLAGAWNQAERRFEAFSPPLYGPWDCARWKACVQLSLQRYDLDTVAAHFGFSRSGESHGALEDAILAGKIYFALESMTIKTGAEK